MPDIRYYKPPESAQKFVAQEAGLLGWAFSTKEGKPALIVFPARGHKSTVYQSFASEEARANYVSRYIENRMRDKIAKQERRKENAVTELKAGDVLYSSWGYDQTNVDFYLVLEVIGNKKIKLVEISSSYEAEGYMYGMTKAVPEKQIGEPFYRLARKHSVRICDVRTANLCDGSPKYTSSYA